MLPRHREVAGAFGYVVGNDNLEVTNFTSTHNIDYRNGRSSEDLFDWTNGADPTYRAPDPGTINYNVQFQSLAKAGDTVLGPQRTAANSVLFNPIFNSALTGEYTLQQGSPALAIGFNTNGVRLAP